MGRGGWAARGILMKYFSVLYIEKRCQTELARVFRTSAK